jgi:hypothetical protein
MTLWLKFKGFMASRFIGADMVLGIEVDCGLHRGRLNPRSTGDSPSKSSSLTITDAAPPSLRGTNVKDGSR